MSLFLALEMLLAGALKSVEEHFSQRGIFLLCLQAIVHQKAEYFPVQEDFYAANSLIKLPIATGLCTCYSLRVAK